MTHKNGKPDAKQTWRFASEKDLVDTAIAIFHDYPIEDAYTEYVMNDRKIKME